MEVSVKLDSSKFIQISIAVPRLNLKFMEPANSKRKGNQLFQLVDIGPWSLCNVLGAFKTAADKSVVGKSFMNCLPEELIS